MPVVPLTGVAGTDYSQGIVTAEGTMDSRRLEQWVNQALSPASSTVVATGSTTARSLADRFADVANVRDFGALGDGLSSDTAAFNAAIASGAKQVFVPAGTYNANITLNAANVSLVGEGKASIIKPLSGTALTIASIIGGNGGTVADLAFDGSGGATEAINIAGFSRGVLRNLYIHDIATAIYINGDSSTETFFSKIYCANVTAYGVRYERTTTTDTGGVYFDTVTVAGTNTAVGMHFNSTNASRTRAFAFLSNCILDNRATYAVYAKNVTNIFVSQCWLTGTAAATGILHVENSKDIMLQEAYIQNSSATGYNTIFIGAVDDFQAHNLRLSGPGTSWQIDATAVLTRCRVWSANDTTTTITNDRTKYDAFSHFVPLSFLNLGSENTQTIAAGVATATTSNTILLGEGGVADSLDTLNGGATGDVVNLTNGSATYAITINHGTGNIRLSGGAARVLSVPNATLTLKKRNNGNWLEIAYSPNT